MDCTFAFERMHAGCDVHHKTLVGVAFSVGMQPWSCRKWCSTFPCFLVCWMTEWMHSAIPQLKNFLNHNVWDNLAACLTRHFNVPSMSPVPTSTMFGIVAKTPAAERAKKSVHHEILPHIPSLGTWLTFNINHEKATGYQSCFSFFEIKICLVSFYCLIFSSPRLQIHWPNFETPIVP